ncbi:hypothetical protein GCM10027288_50440 [Bordetella tumbae]
MKDYSIYGMMFSLFPTLFLNWDKAKYRVAQCNIGALCGSNRESVNQGCEYHAAKGGAGTL